jgi:hypothetical protein
MNPQSTKLEVSTLTITPVSVLTSSLVDRGFIDDVMVSVLTSSVVDRWFIGGVMVSVLASSVVDRGFISGVMVSAPLMNPRSTTLEVSTLTITSPMWCIIIGTFKYLYIKFQYMIAA